MRPLVILFCLLSATHSVLSQKENNIWYFGNRAGLDFNTTSPTPLESDLVAIEGTASISDPSGHLLFYTNGITIWDRNHNIMPNGTGLLGGESSTQAVLIVPLPKSNNRYYVFTTEDYLTNGGMNYSIVNMSLNGGFGDVESSAKNILVVDQVGEKVTGILHSNGIDVWIITHKTNSNEFLSYLLTSNGLNMVPVISPIGSTYSSFDPIGPIRSSHSGSRIISTSTYNSILEIFDFNKITGELSNFNDLYHLFNNQQYVYGIEFSPNDSLVYLSCGALIYNLFQLQLATDQLVKLATSTEDYYGAIQLGSDNRIYITNDHLQYLGIISKPNSPGFSCLYQPRAIKLKNDSFSRVGLPNPVPYSFLRDDSRYSLGSDTILCLGDSLILTSNFPIHCDSINYVWNDGSTGSELVVKSNGVYWLEMTSPCLQFRDTIQVSFLSCQPIILYDLNACRSVMADGSNMDYSEFVPNYPFTPICADVSAEILFRTSTPTNKHSCTPGINNSPAMCVTTLQSCVYDPGNISSIIIEFTINPTLDSTFQITSLKFFEKGPLTYNWINGASGANNYPLLYGIRILKDNFEIYRKDSVNTNTSWTLQNYDFINDSSFTIKEKADFKIELLPYCPVDNNSDVSAWDIDEIMIYGGCKSRNPLYPIIYGKLGTIHNQAITDAEVQLSLNPSFTNLIIKRTDVKGNFFFYHLQKGNSYYLRCIKNNDVLNGVNTLDLIYIQRYLLGIDLFNTFDKFIAADINKSENINVLDLVALRKVLLGVYPTFPNNTSWRFGALPMEEIFTNFSQFKEFQNITNLDRDSLKSDFVGIKIGDLTGDVNLCNALPTRERSFQSSVNLIMNDVEIKPNTIISVQFKVENEILIYGLQFSLDLEGMKFISISSNTINFTKDNYSFKNGVLRVSWNSNNITKINAGTSLFNIEIISSRGGTLSNKIFEFSKELQPEIYLENLEIIGLKLIAKRIYQYDETQNHLDIQENITSQQINLQFDLSKDKYVEIRFYDLSGRCVFKTQKKYLEGINNETVSYNEILGFGLIYCQLVMDDESRTGRFIKL